MTCLLNISRYSNNYYKNSNISNIIKIKNYNPDNLKNYNKLIVACNTQDNRDILELLDISTNIKYNNHKIKRELYIPYIYNFNNNYLLTRDLFNSLDYHKIHTFDNRHEYIKNIHVINPVYFYRWAIKNIKKQDNIDHMIFLNQEFYEELGDVCNKNIVLVCDEIKSGEKIINLCQKLRSYGSRNIYIIATHGIFSNYHAIDNLKKYVKNIYITDSYYNHNNHYVTGFVKIYEHSFSNIYK